MLQNYFKVLIRSLWRKKLFSLLAIAGLAIGMACYLLIVQYARFELNYDSFHEHRDDIYRLQRDVIENRVLTNSYALTTFNDGPALKEEFSQIKEVVRLAPFPDNTVTCGERKYSNEKIVISESAIFSVFSFRLLQGDPAKVLGDPGQVALSQSAARKYFPGEEPLGKWLHIANKGKDYACMVSGVFADVPENSHLKFDVLVSIRTFFNVAYSDWITNMFYNYIRLQPGSDRASLEAKLPAFIEKYILKNVPRAALWKFRLQPLRDIYLYSNLTYDTENGNGKMVYFLLLMGILILIISWINYVNLSTARSMERAREVGIRKVFGGERRQLIRQFLAESVMTNIVPMTVAFLLFVQFMPFLRDLTGKNIGLDLGRDWWFWLHLLLVYLGGSLLSGMYPAFVLSSFKPVTVLNRSRFSQTAGGRILRKILVAFQFAASAVLIILTLTVWRQIDYMKNKDLGIDINNVIGLALPSTPIDQAYIANVDNLKTELQRYPGIKSVAGSLYVPGSDPLLRRLAWRENTDSREGKILSVIFVDYDFLPTYRIELLAGRNFSREFGADTGCVILNQEAARLLGLGDAGAALNQGVSLWQMPSAFKIIGVIKNYRHQSLKKTHDPLVFLLNPVIKNYYSVRIDPNRVSEAISIVKQKWAQVFPGYPLDYFFLDDHFNSQYRDDQQFGRVLGIFVIMAVIITCMGLLSLSYFNALQRTKEIGIRKTFGGSTIDMVVLLAGDTVKLVGLSCLIAWPVAYYLVDDWLQNYADRIGLPWGFFILSTLLLTLVSISTVAYHSLVAARKNPVESLRIE